MKNFVLVLLIECVLLLGGVQAMAQDTIQIASGEWAPYFSETLKHYGFVSQVITEAFASQGVDVAYEFYPWKRSFELTKLGEFNATPGWYRTPEREQWFHFSDGLFKSQIVFFHLKSMQFQWDTVSDLRTLRIGAMIGYKYEETFDRLAENGILNVHRTPREILNFRMLLAHRIDVFVCDIDVGFQTMATELSENERQQITYDSHPLHTRLAHLLFSKKATSSRSLLKAFNQGLRQLKQNGKYDQYLHKSRQGWYLEP